MGMHHVGIGWGRKICGDRMAMGMNRMAIGWDGKKSWG